MPDFWAGMMAIVQLAQQGIQRTGVEAGERTLRAIEVAGRPGVAFGYLAEIPIAPGSTMRKAALQRDGGPSRWRRRRFRKPVDTGVPRRDQNGLADRRGNEASCKSSKAPP